MCVCVCVPAVREHDQRASAPVCLRGAVPAGAGRVSAGGRRHRNSVALPWQPDGRAGLLPSGASFGTDRSSLVLSGS